MVSFMLSMAEKVAFTCPLTERDGKMVSSEYTDILKSVKIVHDDIHRIDFSYLAEFFRMMGIFVCESILVEQEKETDTQKNTKYSAYICVGKKWFSEQEEALFQDVCEKKEWQCIKSAYEKRLSELPEEMIYLYNDVMNEFDEKSNKFPTDMLFRLEESEQKKILKDLMIIIQNRVGIRTDDVPELRRNPLEDLIDIFVDNKIWFHSLNLQYYKKIQVTSEAAKQAFLDAHDELQNCMEGYLADLGEDYSARYICEYAVLWLEVKANEASSFDSRALTVFSVNELADRCKSLCRRYPRFLNAKVLLGLCYAPSTNSTNEALWAFGNAARKLRRECVASPVFYWIGKYYEPYKEYQKDAKEAYELANSCKIKFRNNFKLGILTRNEGNYAEAIEYFNRILCGLELKSKMYLVDPLEIEYLFKTYTQLAYVYYSQKNYRAAITMGECVIKIVRWYITPGRSVEESFQDFFRLFYGSEEEAAKYRNILWHRLNINAAYKILAESYTRIMQPDKAKEYQDKLSAGY